MNIQFSPPDITQLEMNQVIEALKSGWITTGPKVKELEKKLKNYVGSSGCVCLNSQTAAGELSLRLLGIGSDSPGLDDVYGGSEDEVITCAYTYTATASVINHVGAKIVLIDCQPDSLEMDYNALEKAINENTKAIIPIELGGISCDYEKIFSIIEKKKGLFHPNNKLQKAIGKVAVVSDAAHALGAKIKFCGEWKMVGSIADFTNFSFHAVKNFTTAEGGACVWKHFNGIADDDLYNRLQLFSLHGQSKDALAKTKLGAWEYDIVGPWFKCNMTDIMGGLGLAQFERYPKLLERRKQIISKYDNAFKPLGVKVLPHYTNSNISSGHLYITRIPGIGREEANRIIEQMAQLGIAANVHYKPLPMHTAYKKLGFEILDYPNAYAHFANEITLPLHTCLTDEQVDYVIKCYCDVLKEYL